jgi:hypothetical protein
LRPSQIASRIASEANLEDRCPLPARKLARNTHGFGF